MVADRERISTSWRIAAVAIVLVMHLVAVASGRPTRSESVQFDGLIVAAIAIAAIVWFCVNVRIFGWPPTKWPWRRWLSWRK
jgi:hypothetical protein